jgi:hypothetical protein
MLRRIRKLIFRALALCVILAVFSGTALVNAAAAATELPAGFLIGDQDGVHTDAHGYYYIDCRGLVPGQVVRKTLSIRNLEQGDRAPEAKIPYALSMTAEPVMTEGPVDLLDTGLVMKLDGKTVYEGSVRGDGSPDMTKNALSLGVYALGDRKTLEITMTVDPNMPLYGEISKADFRWKFYAHRAQDAAPPKTGILETYWAYFIPVGALGAFSVLLVLKKRRRSAVPTNSPRSAVPTNNPRT